MGEDLLVVIIETPLWTEPGIRKGLRSPLETVSLPDTFGEEGRREAQEIVIPSKRRTLSLEDDLNECIHRIMGALAGTSQALF